MFAEISRCSLPLPACLGCRCVASGAKIILSKLPVGDLATQFFADRNLFCAGRVAQDDMERVAKVSSGYIQYRVVGGWPPFVLARWRRYIAREEG